MDVDYPKCLKVLDQLASRSEHYIIMPENQPQKFEGVGAGKQRHVLFVLLDKQNNFVASFGKVTGQSIVHRQQS